MYLKRWIFCAIIFTLCGIEIYAGLIITEVMENSIDDNYYEFVELYNNSSEAINISSYSITDGGAIDAIVQYSTPSFGNNLIYNTVSISSYSYAVIISSIYSQGSSPYAIKEGTVV